MKIRIALTLILVLGVFSATVLAQTTEFNYQGRLTDGTQPANANYDFQFSLWDAASGGTQVGTTETRTDVSVTGGTFTVRLDFGNQFPGSARFLQVAVRPSGGGAFTTLAPREAITNVPYAVKSISADVAAVADQATTATNSQNLGGVPAGQYVLTTDPRMTDARTPTAGSPDYVWNQSATVQPFGEFNIDGTGRANVFQATTQFNIGSSRVFSIAGTGNTFVGANTGVLNTTGSGNSFVGRFAGSNNTTGSFNTFVGVSAGAGNIGGSRNSLFGRAAGINNSAGNDNSFFGDRAGAGNTLGINNSFFGASSGLLNSIGNDNTFLGFSAGLNTTTGFNNTFAGSGAGSINSTGFNNSFFGTEAGFSTTTGDANSFFGYLAGRQHTSGSNNSFFGKEAGRSTTIGVDNSMFGHQAGLFNDTGIQNSFFGASAGQQNTTGRGNTFLGLFAGSSNISGDYNTIIGLSANVAAGNLTYATAIGANSSVSTSNTIVLGRGLGQDAVKIPGTLTVSNPVTIAGTLEVVGPITGVINNAQNAATALNATTAQNALNLGGIAPGGFLQNTNTTQSANFNIDGTGTAAVFRATTQFNIGDDRVLSADGAGNVFAGIGTGTLNSTGFDNSYFGKDAGLNTFSGFGNTFIGKNAGFSNTTGAFNTMIGERANTVGGFLTNATAIGARAEVSQSNSIVLGSINGVNAASADTNVGIGTTSPQYRLDVVGRIRLKQNSTNSGLNNTAGLWLFQTGPNNERAFIGMENDNSVGLFGQTGGGWGLVMNTSTGVTTVRNLGAAGSTALCRNASNEISTCSSSARYKTNIETFRPGLEIIKRLRPVSFNWLANNQPDFGLVAEEVAAVEPQLAISNEKGEIEGVKYDRVGVVLINAVNEQQKQIEEQREVIKKQQAEIDALKKFICSQNPQAAFCQ